MALGNWLERIVQERAQKVMVLGEKTGEEEMRWEIFKTVIPKDTERVEFPEKGASLQLLGRENWRGRYTPASENGIALPPTIIEDSESLQGFNPKYILTEKGYLYGSRQEESLDTEVYHKALEFLRVYKIQ